MEEDEDGDEKLVQNLECTLVGHSGGLRSVAISADGKRVVSGGLDMTVKIWDMETGAEVRGAVGEGIRAFVGGFDDGAC